MHDRERLAKIARKRSADVSIRLDPETAERYIQAYQCPYCRDGEVYKMLPLHIYQMHGISAYEFREQLGWNRSHKLISTETSELMSQMGKRNINIAWAKFDRHKTCLHRYEDGGQRPEAIKAKQVIANQPETKTRFYTAMAQVDRKAVAAKIPFEVKSARGRKAAKACWEKQSEEQKRATVRRIQSARTPESEMRRIAHAQITMKDNYWSDPAWRAKWRKSVTEGIQATAKIPRSDYAKIVSLYENDKISQGKIASQYGVSGALIHLIIKSYKLDSPTLQIYRKEVRK